MVDLSYGYANARVKGMHSNLLDKDRMREIADVASLNQFIELMEENPNYKKYFVSASTKYSGLELVKRALDDSLAESLQKVFNFVPEKAKPTLLAVMMQWEVNN